MKRFIVKNKNAGDKKAFEIIKKQVLQKPESLIGLAAGKTIDGLYKLISNDVIKYTNLWKKIKVFQIDENLGISPDSEFSFNHQLKKKLKPLLKKLSPKNIFLIDGTENPKKIIKKAYEFLCQNKEMDLVILGIGPEHDPHIAYNTTGRSSLNSKMRVVELHPKILKKLVRALPTRGEARSQSERHATPQRGITLGIKDILKSKKVLLIAYGKEKAKSIKLAFKGKVDTKRASASALKLHNNLEIVLDKDAGKYL